MLNCKNIFLCALEHWGSEKGAGLGWDGLVRDRELSQPPLHLLPKWTKVRRLAPPFILNYQKIKNKNIKEEKSTRAITDRQKLTKSCLFSGVTLNEQPAPTHRRGKSYDQVGQTPPKTPKKMRWDELGNDELWVPLGKFVATTRRRWPKYANCAVSLCCWKAFSALAFSFCFFRFCFCFRFVIACQTTHFPFSNKCNRSGEPRRETETRVAGYPCRAK